MTPEQLAERKRRRTALMATPLGAAFYKFESAHSAAWAADFTEGLSEKRLREAWATSDEARDALIVLIRKAEGLPP